MGNRESNYDIRYERLSNYQYQARIKHLKIEHEEIVLQNSFYEELVKAVLKEITVLDEIYFFNNSQQSKINSLLGTIEKKEIFFDWNLAEKKRMISYKIFSTSYIKYNQVSGKPEAYFPVDNPTVSTTKVPTEPSPPIFFKGTRQKGYEQKKQIFIENKKRALKTSEEQKKWNIEYPNIVKNLKENYIQGDKNSIEIYSKLVLDILGFNINFEKEYSLEYDLENKYLIVNYSIINTEEIFRLLKDKAYNKSYREEAKYIKNNELVKRLNYIWNQIILKVIYTLYKADEINSIKSIHFNGKILVNNEIFKFGKKKYETQIIVSKEQFTDTFLKGKKIYISERIKEFNRDLFFIRELQYEGIYLHKYKKINSSYYELDNGNITSLTIEGNRLFTPKIFKIITNFFKLKEFYIINNSTFEIIPLELFTLINLEEISFSHTQIKNIPNEIINLKNLKKIDLSYNKIIEINQSITFLPHLEKLDLDGNQIKDISLNILNKLLDMKLNYFSLFRNPIFTANYPFYNEELISKLIGDKKGLHIKKKVIFKKSKKKFIPMSPDIDTVPLIITEGKTDWKHFKSALDFFQKNEEFQDLNIDFLKYDDMDMGDSKLEKRLKDDAQIPQSRMRIGIFDCDTKIGKRYEDKKNQKLAENIYAISIPTPSFREYHNGICVEFLYKDEDLKKINSNGRRIFLSDEFSHRGRLLKNREIVVENSSKIKNYIDKKKSKIVDSEVIDKDDNNIALSKNDFATNILEKVAPFDKMNFEGFRGLFELLEEIIPNKKLLKISKLLDDTTINNKNIFDYNKLKDDLIEISLLETKNRNAISKESEDETNDRFRNALSNRKYNVTDQSRAGESSSGINAGERDLVVCNSQGIDESVIEAFILKSLDSTVINKHYEKLVQRYDTVGNSVNFVLVYAKTENFEGLWEKYIKYDRFDNFVDTKDEHSQKNNVRVGISKYGKMKVYHLFINFYSHGGD